MFALERLVRARVRVEPIHKVRPDRVRVDALVPKRDFGLLGGASLLEPVVTARRKRIRKVSPLVAQQTEAGES